MPSRESLWSYAATKGDTHDAPIVALHMVAQLGVCITVLAEPAKFEAEQQTK